MGAKKLAKRSKIKPFIKVRRLCEEVKVQRADEAGVSLSVAHVAAVLFRSVCWYGTVLRGIGWGRSSTILTSFPHVMLLSLRASRALLLPRPSRSLPNARMQRSSSRSSSRSVTHRARTAGSSSHYGSVHASATLKHDPLTLYALAVLNTVILFLRAGEGYHGRRMRTLTL